jgi:hypothetical protein
MGFAFCLGSHRGNERLNHGRYFDLFYFSDTGVRLLHVGVLDRNGRL